MIETIRLEDIRLGSEFQARVTVVGEAVDDYEEAYRDGEVLPPLKGIRLGGVVFLVDGFHRLMALRRVERETVDVDIATGSHADGLLLAAGSNATHGVRRSNEDKRRAVKLAYEAMREKRELWSKTAVAAHASVSHGLVASVQEELAAQGWEFPDRVVGVDGRNRPAKRAQPDSSSNISGWSASGSGAGSPTFTPSLDFDGGIRIPDNFPNQATRDHELLNKARPYFETVATKEVLDRWKLRIGRANLLAKPEVYDLEELGNEERFAALREDAALVAELTTALDLAQRLLAVGRMALGQSGALRKVV